jgi:hypothetical protein
VAGKILKMERSARALEKLSGPSGLMQQLDRYFVTVEQQLIGNQRLHRTVVARLRPEIVKQLRASYAASGLKQRSGKLYQAGVEQALVVADSKGFKVRMAAGFDKTVYIRGSAHQAGSVRSTGGRTSQLAALLSARAKRKIKAAVAKGGSSGSVSVRAARPWQKLDIPALQAGYGAIWQFEANKILKPRSKLRVAV